MKNRNDNASAPVAEADCYASERAAVAHYRKCVEAYDASDPATTMALAVAESVKETLERRGMGWLYLEADPNGQPNS